ncbi:MAG: M56 family metallopeptidase [Flavobacteriaceae bacterium]
MLEYIQQNIIWSGFFYLSYRLFLSKTGLYRHNRIYLILAMILSTVLPFIKWTKLVYIPFTSETQSSVLPALSEINEITNTWNIPLLIYGLILCTLLIWTIIKLSSLVKLINTSNLKAKFRLSTRISASLKLNSKEIPAFSYWNNIILSEFDFNSKRQEYIIQHELAHVKQLHSIDTTLAILFTLINWFNPIAYLLKRQLIDNLEYLADQSVLEEKENSQVKNYQYELLKYAQSSQQFNLTGFAAGSIKKRIEHINLKNNNPMYKIKYTLILSLAVALFAKVNVQTSYAQEKQAFLQERHEVKMELITKTFTKEQLNEVVSRMAKEGLTLKYSGLKYNSDKEIIKISISAQYKDNKGSSSWSSSKGIPNISVGYDNDMPIVSSSYAKPQIFEVAPSTEAVAVFIDENGEKTTVKTTGTQQWTSKDGKHIVVEVDSDEDVLHSTSANVWVSKDTLHETKTIQVIEIDEEGKPVAPKTTKMIKIIEVEEDGAAAPVGSKIQIKTSDSKAKPLYILDGKEITSKEMEHIITENIESIEVLKGEKAAKEYGDKGKNGVILISTKD